MPRREAYEHMSRVAKALASPRRLELLDLLAQRSLRVDELAAGCELSVANTSAHLKALRQAHLVVTERRGREVHCSLSPGVAALLVRVRQLATERLPELAALSPRDSVSAEELLARAERGEVEVLDVRPADEFAAGHLRGARSLPLARLRERLGELPRDREVVAYCRGPFCVMADDAVAVLRAHGLDARALPLGVSELRLLGVPIERTAA